MVSNLGHGGEDRGLGPHHDGSWGRGRERGPGEESGALVLGQGVGVQVMTGAGQAGHAVSGGGAQTALSQVQSTRRRRVWIHSDSYFVFTFTARGQKLAD